VSTQTGDEPPPLKPSDVTGRSRFDKLSSLVADTVARAWFFIACLALVLIWAPSYWLLHDLNLWQLIINTITTIVTFLLVALLQNTESRADKAVQRKLNALAEGMIDIMQALERDDATLHNDIDELRQAVGLEHREGS
jgi:low affinity Fe/Cu permease